MDEEDETTTVSSRRRRRRRRGRHSHKTSAFRKRISNFLYDLRFVVAALLIGAPFLGAILFLLG